MYSKAGINAYAHVGLETGVFAATPHKLAGGELAEQLNALYEYMGRRLLEANLHNKPEYIEEVAGLLNKLSEAWEAIGTSPQPDGAGEGMSAFSDSSISGSMSRA